MSTLCYNGAKVGKKMSSNDNVGRCSVRMWMYGCPDGYCGNPAYGPQEKNQRRYGDYGPGEVNGRWLMGGVWTPGYCSGLACYSHGGPMAPKEEIK